MCSLTRLIQYTVVPQASEDHLARVGLVRLQRGGRQLRRVELGERGQTGPGLVAGAPGGRRAGEAARPGDGVRLPELLRRPVRGDHAALGRDVLAETQERRGQARGAHEPAGVRETHRRHPRLNDATFGAAVPFSPFPPLFFHHR